MRVTPPKLTKVSECALLADDLGQKPLTTAAAAPQFRETAENLGQVTDPSQEVLQMDWRHESACRDEDPELFFPIGNTGPALLQIEEAKAVCRRCPVIDSCLQWALESGQDAGVWGGLSEDERRALKRRNQRARAAMRAL